MLINKIRMTIKAMIMMMTIMIILIKTIMMTMMAMIKMMMIMIMLIECHFEDCPNVG